MGVVKLADYRPQLEVVEHRVADTEDGFMRVANEITDSLLMADLTVRQMKVMLAIMRKTYGFNKPMDRLTNTQIAAMTGIHHTHVCAAKRQLIERKFLIADGVKIGVNKVVSQWISQDSLTLAKTANKTLAKSAIDDLVSVPQFTLNWGESPQEILERVSRWSALLYYDQPDGNLFLTRVGTKRAASGIAEGVNIEQAYYRRSMADRFSDYVGVSMSISPIAGFSPDTAYDSVTLATARDPEAASMRYRKRIIIVESTLMASQQAQRAIDWEMNRRYGRSKPLSVTIDSWRDKAGKLWEPNTLIPVNIPSMQLPDTEMLIAEVTYIRDSDGTHARMYLLPPEAFSVQPYAFYQ
ncbi:replication protein [Escherichia coli]|uniref:replication protein n=1 Tax=Escherichia coli TaxID=562 RepID=UPI001E58DEB9|nr:replication protein [Escherichia coli]MCD8755911.1 replication protein [Escherichia coli]MEB5900200.1 replication protein [Escherichia coli]